QLEPHKNFQLLTGDVREPRDLDKAAEALARMRGPAGGPDVVFHMAAAVGVKTILDRPLQSLDTNLHGAENVLRACARWNCQVLIASTSEVYGKNDSEALSEDSDRVLGAGELSRWWYAVAKMADEALALAYHREGRLKALVVRLFNTVGPRQTG